MTHRLTPAELTDLLGAYAVDAVAPWEADQLEAHLREDPAGRREVDEHHQTLAILGAAVAVPDAPPDGLWDRIAGGLAEAPPPLRLVPAPRARRFARPAAWVGGLAAAAVIAAIAVIGATALRSDRASVEDAYASAVTTAGAEVVALATPDGSPVAASITLLPGGVGYLDADLPALGADRTYQLWAIVGEEVISAGVFGPEPGVAPFLVQGEIAGFALTEEAAGGVAVSSNPPVALWLRDA